MAAWAGRSFVATQGVPAANTLSQPAQHGDTTVRAFPYGELTDSESWEGDAGELLVLATSSDDRMSQLHAGESLSAVVLTATALHLASCPLTQPVEVDTTRAVLRDRVLDGAACPPADGAAGRLGTGGQRPPAS